MSDVGRAITKIGTLAHEDAAGNADQIAVWMKELAKAAPAISEADLEAWVLDFTSQWPDAGTIASDPDAFADAATELLLELGTGGYIEDGDG